MGGYILNAARLQNAFEEAFEDLAFLGLIGRYCGYLLCVINI